MIDPKALHPWMLSVVQALPPRIFLSHKTRGIASFFSGFEVENHMEMTMLERAAKAAEFADEKFVAYFPGEPSVARADPRWALTTARAVLDAIREPSEHAMDCGAYRLPGIIQEVKQAKARDVYRAMIDAALSDSPSERKR